MYWTNNGSVIYTGDKILGDREATQAEIDAYNSDPIRLSAQKWRQAESARLVLTVTTASGHKFNANKEGLDNIMHKEMALLDNATCTWYEDWGSFTTNKVELQEALRLATSAYQTILDTTVGV